MSDIHRKKGDHQYEKGKQYEEGETSEYYNAGLPVVAFTLSDDFKEAYPHVKQVAVSNLLRAKQYIIPSMLSLLISFRVSRLTTSDYPLPPNEEKTEILRVVVRESLSIDMIDRLLTDICSVTETLMNSDTMDLAAWQPVGSSVEKEHSSHGLHAKNKHTARRPMHHGVHRTVC